MAFNVTLCTLIATQDPSPYILADSHGQGMTEQKTKALLEKFKPGLVFTMSTVALAANSKLMYNQARRRPWQCHTATAALPL